MNDGVAIGNLKLNSFVYADDVNLYCSSVSVLPSLIDVCHNYCITWIFKFGIKKTKCMIYEHNLHTSPPKWRLGSDIAIDNKLDILSGAWDLILQLIISLIFWVQLSLKMVNVQNMWNIEYENVNHSIVYQVVGMALPGATVNVNRYLWNSICTPVLTYLFIKTYLPWVAIYKFYSNMAPSFMV